MSSRLLADDMRYFTILLIHFQDVLTDWSRSIVWLLLPVINAGLYLVFWHAAFLTNNRVLSGWDIQSIITYYLLVIISIGMFVSHVEEYLSKEIHKGELGKYLLKPFPLYLFLLFTEIPYRVLQGFYAIVAYCILAFFFPFLRLEMQDSWTTILLASMFICSFFLMHTYKALLGMLTFWMKDIRGFRDTSDVTIILLAGFSIPLDILPTVVQQVNTFLPFPYFVYYPVLGLLGKMSFESLLGAFSIQLIWLSIFVVAYKIMLTYGLRKFTAAGQ